jgi:hypothetical protein
MATKQGLPPVKRRAPQWLLAIVGAALGANAILLGLDSAWDRQRRDRFAATNAKKALEARPSTGWRAYVAGRPADRRVMRRLLRPGSPVKSYALLSYTRARETR